MYKTILLSLLICAIYALSLFCISLSLRPLYVFSESGYVDVVNQRINHEEIPNILEKIAYCESGNRQYEKNTELPLRVLRGKKNQLDVGRFQINEFYHSETAKKLGIDIYTWEGNTQYALYLYGKYGTQPWNWSKPCWIKL